MPRKSIIMAKYLRYIEGDSDVDIKKTEQFDLCLGEHWYVFSLFECYFKKSVSENIAKLFLRFTNDAEKHLNARELLGVLEVQFYVNAENFTRLDDNRKKRFLLDSIYETYVKHSSKYGWNKENLEHAYNKVVANGFRLVSRIGKSSYNKSTKSKGQCFIIFDKTIRLSIDVWRGNNNSGLQQHFITEIPGSLHILSQIVGTLAWEDDETIVLNWRDKRACWKCNTNTGYVEFVYHKYNLDNNNPQMIYQLACLYLDGVYMKPDADKAVQLLKLSAELGYKHAQAKLCRMTQKK